MLNEEKLKLMTGIAMFEKAEGKRISLVRRYFKSDYISRNLLRAFLGYTFCWLVGIILMAACRIEDILSIVSLEEMDQYFSGYGTWYVVGLIVYMLLTLVVCLRRYKYASRGMKVYVSKMKRLNKRYEVQSRVREHGKEVRNRD